MIFGSNKIISSRGKMCIQVLCIKLSNKKKFKQRQLIIFELSTQWALMESQIYLSQYLINLAWLISLVTTRYLKWFALKYNSISILSASKCAFGIFMVVLMDCLTTKSTIMDLGSCKPPTATQIQILITCHLKLRKFTIKGLFYNIRHQL